MLKISATWRLVQRLFCNRTTTETRQSSTITAELQSKAMMLWSIAVLWAASNLDTMFAFKAATPPWRALSRFSPVGVFVPSIPAPRGSLSLSSSLRDDEQDRSDLTTKRIPLERIFNESREYLFLTRKNIRNYEWGIPEVEELFESVLFMVPEEDEDDSEVAINGRGPLELNAITIMPSPGSDKVAKRIGKTSQRYDVHDGQQRLVSISLIYAALRDNFLEWGKLERKWELDADIASKAIYPTKHRYDDVTRIQLKEKKDSIMHRILTNEGIADGSNNGSNKFYTNYKRLYTAKERKLMALSELYILEAYEYLRGRVKELGPERAVRFLEALSDDTFLLLCIPSSTKMARNFVLGLGKGKNLELVDELKGLVCFQSINDEESQDEVLKEWDALSEDVGRDTVSTACIHLAQMTMQRPVQKNGELDLFEDFLRMDGNDGATFFNSKLVPTTKILQSFYDGTTLLRGAGVKTFPSLTFLAAASQVRTSKDIEMVILYLLILHADCKVESQRGDIEDRLFELEGVALSMMLTKPKPAIRRQRCFDILNHLMSKESRIRNAEKGYNPLSLTLEEKHSTLQSLDKGEFGKGVGSKIGKAVLERLNEHELIISSQVKKIQQLQKTLHIEHILPQKHSTKAWSHWKECEADLWLHRFGNLVLLNQKLNASLSNGSFTEKRNYYKSSPYPMTRHISEMYKEQWTVDEVQENHKRVVALAGQLWDLTVHGCNCDQP